MYNGFMENNLIPIRNLIYEIRGHKVMLDSDLARLYEVETKVLNQSVKRNIERFPADFMFQITQEEYEVLRSQIVTSKIKTETRGGRQYLPYVFTEQGVAMLSSVLKSKKAIQINVQIMRTFVQMRQWALSNKEFSQRLLELEHYFIQHCKENNQEIERINQALNYLIDVTKPSQIGFKTE